MSDELDIQDIPVRKPAGPAVQFAPLGEAITPDEVKGRLSHNLYMQLSDGDDAKTEEAISRAEIYVGAIVRRFKMAFNLDDTVTREIVLIHTIYELHIALGHEEAGREYRTKAKDLILAAWGDYPDSDDKASSTTAVAAVAVPKKRPRPF